MVKEITRADWYQYLIDDLRSIITETRWVCTEVTIRKWHEIGSRILQSKDEMPLRPLLKLASQDLGTSDKTLYDAVRFAEKNPDIDQFFELQDKAISWHKITQKLLTEGKRRGKKKDEKVIENDLSSLAPSYQTFVENHACILCKKKPVDKAHWPRTRVRGGFYIPLCRICHRHQEDMAKGDFLEKYTEPIDNYLCELIQLIEQLSREK